MNILVVDDEPLIHISIEKLIHTCSGEETVFHAYNGHQMLAALGEREFALAFVDIKMPGPSGLEAIRQAREIAPFTRYYIMTGFDEFEYAKQAIKLKVDDYLMKPLDLKTIRETVEAARSQVLLNLEHKKNVFRNWLESTLNRRESFFNEFAGHYCGLMVVNVDAGGISPEQIQAPFQSYDGHLVSVFTESGLMLLCFSEKSDYLLEMYRSLSTFSYPEGLTCFAASITSDPGELKASLTSLMDRSCLRVLLGLGSFYYLTPLMDIGPVKLDFCRTCLEWRAAFTARDYTAFSNCSELIVNQFYRHEELQKHLENLCSFLSLTLDRPVEIPPDAAALKEQLAQAAREFVSGSDQDSKAQSIIRFIQEHYAENISAAELSERFGLSANHITNLLKSTLGIRYNDYVTQLRLSRAKELLLSTRLSVKEITTACGYFSQSHFTKLFLEHEGCTPAEYRKDKGVKPLK